MTSIPFKLVKRDELQQLNDKIASLVSQINTATEFVKEIEKGNLAADYSLADVVGGNADILAESLLSLRLQLKSYSLQEKERNWVTEGLAKFIDILRSKNEDVSELTDNIIRNLVRYMGANQGALYLVNDENPKDVFIEMAACYAYERKKHLNKRVDIGEGLTGQAFLERDTIYITEIPQSYMRITSGLGNASPSNLLIVPLKIEETVFGLVEVASFEKIEQYQIEFVQRLGESIASTLSGVKTGQKTHKLLEQSQMYTEQMRSQEEEMRQNMEELSATQEEMQRVLKEAQDKEKYLNDLINVPKDSIYTVDKEYKIISFNKAMSSGLDAMGITDLKGFDILQLYPDAAEKQKQKQYYDRAFAGENFEITLDFTHQGVTSYYTINYAPLRNELGEAFAVACFGKDVTAMISAQKLAEQALLESKQQSEEIQLVLKDAQDKEKYLNELINVPNDSIFTLDKDFKILSYNKIFGTSLEEMLKINDLKGFDFMNLFPDEAEKQKQRNLLERAFNGENFEVTSDYNDNGKISYYSSNYAPLHNESGEIFAIAGFAKDITAIISAQKLAESALHESKQQAEELRAQEEELRQNMEELSATQEEMNRLLKDIQGKEKYLDDLINVTRDSIFTVDKEYKIISYNKAMADGLAGMGIANLTGFDMLQLYTDPAEKKTQKQLYDRALAGENFEVTTDFEYQGVMSHYAVSFAPLNDEDGKAYAVACFGKDVTALVSAQKQAERLLKEAGK